MKLENVLSVLRQVAPEHLAEDWDQVGLHLAGAGKPVRKAMLCIDLTPPVLAEAVANKCQLIVAYHPPIFHPLKRLADRDWKEQMLAEAVRKGIAVYSPHTALDAVRQGMNDWLCEGLGKHAVRWSIGIPKHHRSYKYKVVVYAPRTEAKRLRGVMSEAGAGCIGWYQDCSFNADGIGTFRGMLGTNPAVGEPERLETVEETRIEMICPNNDLGQVLKAVREAHPYEEPAIDVFELHMDVEPESEEQTPGRVHVLKRPVSAQTLVRRLKRHLGIKKLKAAIPPGYGYKHEKMIGCLENGVIKQIENDWYQEDQPDEIDTIAVCVGAGGSLFEKYPGADAYITGEMQHHQVLDLYHKGKVVILAGHTNTERPFLKNYRDAIVEQGGVKVDWLISETDVAPIGIV
ncbi:MAG: Nif3-like dinuclear metal center hexameric protein [Planctomycetota bacterium]